MFFFLLSNLFRVLRTWLSERPTRGGEGEADVERRQIVAEQQDSRPDEVVQGHPQRHLLPAQDSLQPDRHLLHQELVGHLLRLRLRLSVAIFSPPPIFSPVFHMWIGGVAVVCWPCDL